MTDHNYMKEVPALIAAKMEGIIRDEDQVKLNEWINVSPEHRRLYEEYVSVNFLSEKLRFVRENSWKDSYKESMERIVRNERRLRIVRVCRYAAVMLLLVSVGGFAYFFSKNQLPQIAFVENERILPGNSKAILTLSDGKQINITDVAGDNPVLTSADIRVTGDSIRYGGGNSKEESVLYHTITIPRGGEYTLTLSDGSSLKMNSESELRFPIHFSGKTREVYMKGEIFFNVARDTASPFIIHSREGDIRVLGTSFNVRDYGDEAFLETTLVSGKVAFMRKQQEFRLCPGEQLKVDRGKGGINIRPVDVRLACSWVDGRLVFEKQRLEDIMNTLTRWYDFEVVYVDPAVKEVLFTGNVKRYDDLNPILNILRLVNKVGVEVKGNYLFISSQK